MFATPCALDHSQAKTIVTTHKNTDFDAMASMVAAMVVPRLVTQPSAS
jgi:nanoRNase/pAp phosphatase (c-di-AMP/oligoRNAs hydrolase)